MISSHCASRRRQQVQCLSTSTSAPCARRAPATTSTHGAASFSLRACSPFSAVSIGLPLTDRIRSPTVSPALAAGPPAVTSVIRTPTRHEVERSVQPSGSRPIRTSRDGIAPATSNETTPLAAKMALDMAVVSL
eukprot:scaffold19193_cov62-Phaeocystis_antarctica.AAC.2